MKSKKLQGSKIQSSTQKFLDIAEIKDDTVILKDGTLRGVLLVSSINFALKNEEEQKAIIGGYVQFLNSIDFPLQIVVQSRKLNLDDYLFRLEQLEKEQINELLRAQMADYLSFVREMVELGEIMTKRFYVVVPYNPIAEKKQKGFFSQVGKLLAPTAVIKLERKKFDIYKERLDKRVGYVNSGLASTGLRAVRLETQNLIELYYQNYNPDLASREKMPKVEKLQVES